MKQAYHLSFSLMITIALALLFAMQNAFSAELNSEQLAQYHSITNLLRCPTCQGLSVKESESDISNTMKAEVKALILEGKSDSEILDFFEQRYGEWILRQPRIKGLNTSLFLLPLILLLAGAGFIIYRIRKNR